MERDPDPGSVLLARHHRAVVGRLPADEHVAQLLDRRLRVRLQEVEDATARRRRQQPVELVGVGSTAGEIPPSVRHRTLLVPVTFHAGR
jgi:hypothetical protein